MMTIHTAQAGTIGAAAALFALVACFLARDAPSRAVVVAGVLFCTGAAARAILVEPEFVRWSGPVRPILVVLCLGHAAAFLTFSRALFEDAAEIGRRDAALWSVLVAFGLLVFGGGTARPELADMRPLFAGAEMFTAAAALFVAWRGAAVDLVERRRSARFAFVALGSVHVIVLGGTEIVLNTAPTAGWIGLLNTSGLAIVAAGLAMAVGGFRDEEAFVSKQRQCEVERGTSTLKVISRSDPADVGMDCGEFQLLERLNRLMDVERLHRDEALTIKSLAGRLNVSERSLRALINRRLGYRNFSTYLNARRLSEVTAALSDSQQAEVPISTIALDAGFGSLGPFNRAFRTAVGMTPTEFRDRSSSAAERPRLAKSVFG